MITNPHVEPDEPKRIYTEYEFPKIEGSSHYISGVGEYDAKSKDSAELGARNKALKQLVKHKSLFVISVQESYYEKLEVGYEMLINTNHMQNVVSVLASVTINRPLYKYKYYQLADGKYQVICVAYKEVQTFFQETLSAEFDQNQINELLSIVIDAEFENKN